jgi:hypothetical protein
MHAARLICAVAMLTAGPAFSQPPTAPVAPLPEGRLLLVGGNSAAANFVALDQSTKGGPTADEWQFRVFAKPVELSRPGDANRKVSTQSLAHLKVDCAKRTFVQLSLDAFDESGRWVLGMEAERARAIEANSTQDFLAKVMCDGVQPPQVVVVTGHAAAVKLARQILGQASA